MEVIGNYRPRRLDKTLRVRLREKVLGLVDVDTFGLVNVDTLGVIGLSDLVRPETNVRTLTEEPKFVVDVRDWHVDVLGGPGHVVLWSNKYPTVVRDKQTHEQLSCRHGDILLFDNELCEHRMPDMTVEQAAERWLFRMMFVREVLDARYVYDNHF